MGAVATFDYPTWVARYPEFSSVSPTLAQAYFSEATLYLANDGSGPVCDSVRQLDILNMLTAHIASRYATTSDGQSPSNLVGRISSASEGSVSVSAEMPALPAAAAWYAQSKYGLDAWQALAAYRTFRYVARSPCCWPLPSRPPW